MFEDVLDYVPDGAELKAKLNDTTRAQLLRAMPSLKERAKTLIELIDGFLFHLRRPAARDRAEGGSLADAGNPRTDRQASRRAGSRVTDGAPKPPKPPCGLSPKQNNLKLGAVAQPLRVALTGRTTSPGIFDVLAVLGREECLARLADQAAA